MKLQFPLLGPNRSGGRRRFGAFTLPEVVVAMAVFILVVAGVLSTHMFGLRLFEANKTKLTATEWSRQTFGKITDEVRSCSAVQIGNVKNGVFEALLDGEVQTGTGLLIYPTADTNHYVVYFLNTADRTFRRTTEQPGSAVILADAVTNSAIFSAQNLMGQVLTNNLNNRVIHLELDFYQPERFLVDSNNYRLETSVTKRME